MFLDVWRIDVFQRVAIRATINREIFSIFFYTRVSLANELRCKTSENVIFFSKILSPCRG